MSTQMINFFLRACPRACPTMPQWTGYSVFLVHVIKCLPRLDRKGKCKLKIRSVSLLFKWRKETPCIPDPSPFSQSVYIWKLVSSFSVSLICMEICFKAKASLWAFSRTSLGAISLPCHYEERCVPISQFLCEGRNLTPAGMTTSCHEDRSDFSSG